MSRSSRFLMVSTYVAFATIAPAYVAAQQARPNAASAARSDAIDSATRTAVLAARDAIWHAWFAHDTAALRRLLPRSTTAGGPEGWESRAEIVAGSRSSVASGRRLVDIRFDDTRMHANGDVVVVFSSYTMVLEQQGQRNTVSGRASEVFVKTNGTWENPFWYLGPP